jgi:hypothetical protein
LPTLHRGSAVVQLDRLRLISFDGVIAAPMSVQYLDWFVPLLDKNIDEAIFSSPFLILQEGTLSIVDEFEVCLVFHYSRLLKSASLFFAAVC